MDDRSINDTKPVLDLVAALERVDGDREFYLELVETLFASFPETLQSIWRAIKSNDGKALKGSAHSVKGAFGNLGAIRCFENAYRLERMGAESKLEEATAAVEELAREFERFKAEVTKIGRE